MVSGLGLGLGLGLGVGVGVGVDSELRAVDEAQRTRGPQPLTPSAIRYP